MKKTFQVWADGDRTVGDGTLQAKVELDMAEDKEELRVVKDALAESFSLIWDTAVGRISVMTQEEYDAYTAEENESGPVLKKFEVQLCRTSVEALIVRVDAVSADAARRLALEKVETGETDDYDWNMEDSDTAIQDVMEVKKSESPN